MSCSNADIPRPSPRDALPTIRFDQQCRGRTHAGTPSAWRRRAVERPSRDDAVALPALSRRRYPRPRWSADGSITSGSPSGRGFSAALCSCATRSAARPRLVAAERRRGASRFKVIQAGMRIEGARRGGVARDPGGRWPRFPGGFVPVPVVGLDQSLKDGRWAKAGGPTGRARKPASGILSPRLAHSRCTFGIKRDCDNSIL